MFQYGTSGMKKCTLLQICTKFLSLKLLPKRVILSAGSEKRRRRSGTAENAEKSRSRHFNLLFPFFRQSPPLVNVNFHPLLPLFVCPLPSLLLRLSLS